MISHFAVDNGRRMHECPLPSETSEGLLKDIDFERRQTSCLFLPFHTRSLWNSNLGTTNTVITFDLVSFELQMGDLDIWLVPNQGLRDNGEANVMKQQQQQRKTRERFYFLFFFPAQATRVSR